MFQPRCTALRRALLAHYQRLKDARGVLDFTDIEYRTHSLLTEDDHAAYMQYKLDARYRHILLDEFQDTNPLQWQILKSWFDAAVGAERTPHVFVVGDPKQSIYRFRGADARLFNLAKQELGEHFGARHLTQDASWRNAQPILDVVNRLFAVEPAFTPFQPHHAHQSSLPGQVWLLPLETKTEAAEAAQTGLRNPLTTPLADAAESAHQREAERVSPVASKPSSANGRLLIKARAAPPSTATSCCSRACARICACTKMR